MENIPWTEIGGFVSAVGIPVLALVMAVIENRSSKRVKARKRLDELTIESWEKTGNVIVANANITLDGQSDASLKKLKKALDEYNSFRTDVDKFKTNQTARTL